MSPSDLLREVHPEDRRMDVGDVQHADRVFCERNRLQCGVRADRAVHDLLEPGPKISDPVRRLSDRTDQLRRQRQRSRIPRLREGGRSERELDHRETRKNGKQRDTAAQRNESPATPEHEQRENGAAQGRDQEPSERERPKLLTGIPLDVGDEAVDALAVHDVGQPLYPHVDQRRGKCERR
jgi:hypothetical protein